MNDNTQEKYRCLYRIVESNMKTAGKCMEFEEHTFLSALGEYGNVADILRWRNNSTKIFLENIYMQLLERFPDAYVRERWGKEERKSLDDQRRIVKMVVNSQEFLQKNSFVKNNIYEESVSDKSGIKERLVRPIMCLVIPAARRLPRPVKVIIKRCLKWV